MAGAQTRPVRFLRHGMLPLPRVLGGGRVAEEIAEFEVDVGAVVAQSGPSLSVTTGRVSDGPVILETCSQVAPPRLSQPPR